MVSKLVTYCRVHSIPDGSIAPWEQLDERQQRGKRLFLSACITCHDHGRVDTPGTVWESRAAQESSVDE